MIFDPSSLKHTQQIQTIMNSKPSQLGNIFVLPKKKGKQNTDVFKTRLLVTTRNFQRFSLNRLLKFMTDSENKTNDKNETFYASKVC